MSQLELPHSNGCLVCGRTNPHGLHLNLHVNPETGQVSTDFVPRTADIGFEGIIHGGILATVMDEAMVWAAIWAGKRMCVAAEMTIRFRHSAYVGQMLRCATKVESHRPRLLTVTSQIIDNEGVVIATATGKYIPVSLTQSSAFIASLVNEPATATAMELLKAGHDASAS